MRNNLCARCFCRFLNKVSLTFILISKEIDIISMTNCFYGLISFFLLRNSIILRLTCYRVNLFRVPIKNYLLQVSLENFLRNADKQLLIERQSTTFLIMCESLIRQESYYFIFLPLLSLMFQSKFEASYCYFELPQAITQRLIFESNLSFYFIFKAFSKVAFTFDKI